MKEALYQWIKNLAVFYILLSAVLHLVPQGAYEKYVRFFMGLLLILLMSTPVFSLLGKGSHILDSFRTNFARENRLREQEEFDNLQKMYLEKGYEAALEKKIAAALTKKCIRPVEVKVHIEGEKPEVTVRLEKKPTVEEERGIEDGIQEICGLVRGEYQIETYESGMEAVGGVSAAGTSALCGGASGFP